MILFIPLRSSFTQLGSWMGHNDNYYKILDLGIKIFAGIVIAVGIPFLGNYFERQNYYNNVVTEYTTFLEELLIEDRLYYRAIKKFPNNGQSVSDSNYLDQEEDSINNQIKGIARAHTEITIRALSENDGFLGVYFKRNPHRQKLLMHLLREAELGFKKDQQETTSQDKDQQERASQDSLASFLQGIDLGRLDHCQEGEKNHKCQGIDLDEIILSRAILDKSNFAAARLNRAILDSANLTEAHLIEAELNEASLFVVNLKGADLQKAKLKKANLQQANLIKANLKGADLRKAKLEGILFDKNTLKGLSNDDKKLLESKGIYVKPNFNREKDELNKNNRILAQLKVESEDVFHKYNLSEVDLTNAKLDGLNLEATRLKKANLTGADLTGADLTEADLTRADLTRATTDPNLTDSILCRTTMPNGEVKTEDYCRQ